MSKKSGLKSLPIYFTIYASFFDIHAQLPILALFAASVGADPFRIGLVVGIYSIFNIMGNAIGGIFIDRWGWRMPLILGLVLVNFTLYSYQLVESTLVLLIVRALNGFSGGILIPSTLAALSPKSGKDFKTEHNKNVSYYGIAVGLAAFSGPPFAGILSGIYGFKNAYLGIAIIMSAALLFVLFFAKSNEAKKSINSFHHVKLDYFKIPTISMQACLLSFALMGCTGTLAAFLPDFAKERGFSQGEIGMLFGIFAFLVVLLQFIRSLSKKINAKNNIAVLIGFMSLALALLIINFTYNRFVFSLGVGIFGIGFGIIFPTILVMVMQGISPDKKGIITGIFFSFYSLGTAIIPPFAGFIWQKTAIISPPVFAIIAGMIIIAFAYLIIPKITSGKMA